MTFRLSHLALLLAVTTVLTAIGVAVATYRVADAEFRDVLEDDLEDQSQLLAQLLEEHSVRLSDESLRELELRLDLEEALLDTRVADVSGHLDQITAARPDREDEPG